MKPPINQTNLLVHSGSDFSHDFYLKNDDKTPTDISGFVITANLSKHSNSINVLESTSERSVYRFIEFTVDIPVGVDGMYTISLNEEDTLKLEEGKYVYSVVMKDGSGFRSEVMSGLVFVDNSFGYIGQTNQMDPSYP